LILEPIKQMAIELVDEAVAAGAGQSEACEVLGITCRTLCRWRGAARHCPQALSEAEKDAIVEICNQPENQSLPPSQIVPRLVDRGIYIASESTVYRVLRKRSQINRRGRAHAPRRVSRPRPLSASTCNRVWSWDITYLPSSIKGQFFRLYMVLDIYSRKIVGWEVHHDELASHAAQLVRRTCACECVMPDQLVLHADNGGPMKGATMLAMLQSLGLPLPSAALRRAMTIRIPKRCSARSNTPRPIRQSRSRTLRLHAPGCSGLSAGTTPSIAIAGSVS